MGIRSKMNKEPFSAIYVRNVSMRFPGKHSSEHIDVLENVTASVVEGEPVRGPDRRRIFVFQENGVFPWLNVRENVGFGLRKDEQTERERTIAHYIDMVGLRGFEDTYP